MTNKFKVSEKLRPVKKTQLPKISKKLRFSESIDVKNQYGISKCKQFTSSNGYRSAVVCMPSKLDYVFFEARIISNVGYARIGVGTENAELNGPIGMDIHGYSFGSKNGYFFHQGVRLRYSEKYAKNDIVSCLLFTEGTAQKLIFFVNGERASKEPVTIRPANYYPAVSACQGCVLSVNFGPYFTFKDKIAQTYTFLEG